MRTRKCVSFRKLKGKCFHVEVQTFNVEGSLREISGFHVNPLHVSTRIVYIIS